MTDGRRHECGAERNAVRGWLRVKPSADRYIVRDAKVSRTRASRPPRTARRRWTLRYRVHGQQRRLKLRRLPSSARLAKARTRRPAAELRKVDGWHRPARPSDRRRSGRRRAGANATTIEASVPSPTSSGTRSRTGTYLARTTSAMLAQRSPAGAGRAARSVESHAPRLAECSCRRSRIGAAPIYANRIARAPLASVSLRR